MVQTLASSLPFRYGNIDAWEPNDESQGVPYVIENCYTKSVALIQQTTFAYGSAHRQMPAILGRMIRLFSQETGSSGNAVS